MIIKLEKFGKILLFRENGKKAFLAIQTNLKKLILRRLGEMSF